MIRTKHHEAYKNFDTFVKTENLSMSDYIIEFDKRYSKSKKYDMTLPEAVLAFKLLDNAGLSSRDKQLALTASSDVKYTSMKSALQRIFGERMSGPSENTGIVPSITIKQEPVYYTQHNKGSKSKEKGTNPLNRFGKRTKCAVCQSVFHWAKDCPDKVNSVNFVESESEIVENCNITLFTKEQPPVSEIFVLESACSAIIDTACTRTVCGENWFKQLLERTGDITTVTSSRAFKFGDGKVVNSFMRATIPAQIGSTNCKIETEIVKADIPLLLSKASLKKAGTVLDLKNDRAIMFNKPVELEFTSSGHYCVNIVKTKPEIQNSPVNVEENVLNITDGMSTAEKRKTLVKIHKQFGHATFNRLSKLINKAGMNNADTLELLRSVCENCDICMTNKRPSSKPVVGLPLATEFNETVAVDLHELEHNVWYLHIIDEFTRFSAGCIMKTKKGSEFVKKFLESWISIHGSPRRLYSDNGGEFNNDEVRDMAENFNIEVKTTAAYSPWSNGLLERHNQTLTDTLLKLKADNNCDWDIALSWALMAKNALDNEHGYSPYQLVYGRNPNLPSVLTDKLPALEGTTMSEVVGKHIETLHSARTAFTRSECSERIRRALRKQTRPSGISYQTGDKVYYKRPDNKEWKGPGVVIGQDGAVVFVRHGGMLVRVHQCRLTKVSTIPETEENKNTGNFEQEKEAKRIISKSMPVHENKFVNFDSDTDNENDSDSNVEAIENGNIEGQDENANNEGQDENVNNEGQDENANNEEQVENAIAGTERPKLADMKTGQTVKYKNAESGEQCVAKVTGRAGKATGSNKNWFNLQYLEPITLKGAEISVDMSKLKELENVAAEVELPSSDDDSVMIFEDVSFREAKLKELNSWKNNSVYEQCTDTGQKCISTRWICSLKDTSEGTIHKARLVARGFEEFNRDDIPKDSPTCGTDSLRLVLAILAQRSWKTRTMDIKTAFLQGAEIERKIYVKPPMEAQCKDIIWKLRKCVYGLSDASLSWYNRVKEVLEQCKVSVSKVDPAVFFWKNNKGSVEGVLTCHVDDFLWGGSKEFEEKVINSIRSTFCVGKEELEENGSFPYVGIELSKHENDLHLRQNTYQNSLKFIPIEKSRMGVKEELLTKEERELLQSKIGQILWIARQSRPDVIFDASNLASSLKKANVQTLNEANKIIKNLKSETVTLKFRKLGKDNAIRLVVFSDSSLGNLSDGGTQGGHFIVLVGENGIFSPITWQSKRIRRVARSTLAAETLAMADAIDSGIFIASLYTELMYGKADPTQLPITCLTDCHSLWDAIKSTKQVSEKGFA
ncbi:unnamed protein product [Mytilus edulis]|uniref:Integrase catalytic domain-containing protein n=1 Tax=Mytilus edulis TaxID=6550 RepID=A0A8S3QM78_MYTED|nr:unnamed protein product [Mytilus edulis]